MQTTKVPMQLTVRTTVNYAKFNILEGNRIVNELHLKRLIESMKEQYLISPIVVNEEMDVIDGQHRLQACAELNLPVHYIVCEGYGHSEIHRYNTNSKNWNMDDFLEGYCEMGYDDYLKYRIFVQKYGFGHRESISMLTGRIEKDCLKTFREGGFKIVSYAKGAELAAAISRVGEYYEGFKRRNFVLAMINLLRGDQIDIEQLLKKLRYLSTKLVDCVTTKDYEKLLLSIYTYKSRQK